MNEVAPARLQREWALCALAAASARFVPVPLVDDVIKERALRTAVARTWSAHGRPANPEVIGLLCGDTRGFWNGVAASAARLPLKLALYPVRKVVRLVTAVRGVGRDLAEVLLLARAVDRCLRAGWFAAADPQELQHQARLVRRAHEQTVSTADLRVLEHGMRAALGQVGGLRQQAAEFARRAFGRDAPDPARAVEAGTDVGTDVGPDVDPRLEPSVEQGARQVQAVLERPEIAGLLATLDRRFDAALGALGAPA
jgi:hypothetical protein